MTIYLFIFSGGQKRINKINDRLFYLLYLLYLFYLFYCEGPVIKDLEMK